MHPNLLEPGEAKFDDEYLQNILDNWESVHLSFPHDLQISLNLFISEYTKQKNKLLGCISRVGDKGEKIRNCLAKKESDLKLKMRQELLKHRTPGTELAEGNQQAKSKVWLEKASPRH